MGEVNNELSITMYLHCRKCLDEIPADTSPSTWAQLDVGWTEIGLQVWCKRHKCNVVNIDFEGQAHPADDTSPVYNKPRLVK